MNSSQEIDVIRNIIAAALEVDAAHIDGPVNFVTDLGADSLRVIEILARLETDLQIRIGQEMLMRMVSLDTVAEVVEESRAAMAA